MQSSDNKKIFVFLGGNNFWEGLFDTNNIKFIKNLFELKMADFSHILMTIITPKQLSFDQHKILLEKKTQLKKIAHHYGATIDFCHINGRTIRNLLSASKEIFQKTNAYEKRYIWSQNYYNCLLGTLVKKQLPDSYLHFELLGLVPEEELYYSESNVVFRLAKFLVLKIIGRIDLKFSDSVSVVSKRFKEYIISKYHLRPGTVDITPCVYDDKIFFPSQEARTRFRSKYGINDHQKLVLYSGMLQKWQKPDVLFAFIKKLQMQDVHQAFRFMIMTFDQEKARQYASKYEIKHLIIDAGSGDDLNGVYNAADIGISCRSSDLVSKVSSPVKIPEYLATQNSLVLLESIGDFGIDLKTKDYALVKKDNKDLLNTTLEEINRLKKPDSIDLNDIFNKYCLQGNTHIFKRILEKQKS
ncbi:MAG: glycosyltransferase family 4 protein [Desulfobacteraceae bacterium]|nr:hypothetical protein [Desulfobacteraceae bacterium]MBC2755120.1 glycosyltransferase family 4 protein [Desulfobacteraceae bacterium]